MNFVNNFYCITNMIFIFYSLTVINLINLFSNNNPTLNSWDKTHLILTHFSTPRPQPLSLTLSLSLSLYLKIWSLSSFCGPRECRSECRFFKRCFFLLFILGKGDGQSWGRDRERERGRENSKQSLDLAWSLMWGSISWPWYHDPRRN